MFNESLSKRKRWRMLREDASTEGMSIDQTLEGWLVTGPDGVCAGPFATEAEAWRWLDRVPTRRYGG